MRELRNCEFPFLLNRLQCSIIKNKQSNHPKYQRITNDDFPFRNCRVHIVLFSNNMVRTNTLTSLKLRQTQGLIGIWSIRLYLITPSCSFITYTLIDTQSFLTSIALQHTPAPNMVRDVIIFCFMKKRKINFGNSNGFDNN